MSPLYPLRLQPIFRQYLWGGRRLAELGKPIGDEANYAESWEVVDRGVDQSVVVDGPLAGTTLGELVRTRGAALLGKHHPQERFPLLVKLLDAHVQLSVQVHPNDAQAALLDPPDLGKTEAWVILTADPGSYIYAGLKPGVDRAQLLSAIEAGECEALLHRLEPQTGDCIFLPAGTVHALGSGLMVAEIQQSSDVTYRLFDWNRKGPDGKTRPLHIAQALEVIDFASGPVMPQKPALLDVGRERLVASEAFVLDRISLAPGRSRSIGGDSRMHVLMVIGGNIQLTDEGSARSLTRGEVVLIPATCRVEVSSSDSGIVLDAYLM